MLTTIFINIVNLIHTYFRPQVYTVETVYVQRKENPRYNITDSIFGITRKLGIVYVKNITAFRVLQTPYVLNITRVSRGRALQTEVVIHIVGDIVTDYEVSK